MTTYGEVHVAVDQLRKVVVREDNVRWFNRLMASNGTLFALDVRPYYEMFLEFGIEFKGPALKK